MNQTAKTLIFVAAAAASVAVAAGTYYSNKPASLADFNDVGDQFFPEFEDPATATALRVAAYNGTSGKTEVFKVENKDGRWQIPTHHNYPADGKDRLSKTAASMIGVVRQALIERSKAAQRRYGVLDPLDSEVAGTEGRGDRITLYRGDEVLVDIILGKKVENSSTMYYVRRPDEDRIYTADLGNFQVSTKFGDWIEKDILQVQSGEVRELVVSRYYVDEAQGKVVQEGQIEMKRETAEAPWTLQDLKPELEKLKLAEVNPLLQSLEELKIVGVRQKPEALIAGLKSKDGKIAIDPFIARDLQQKGVFISKGGEFVYNEGKVNVGTQAGVLYELGFGEEFSGSDLDIEIGQPTPAEEAKDVEQETAAKTSSEKTADGKKPEAEKEGATDEKGDEQKPADGSESEEAAKPGTKKSRYLFVTVYFDKDLLGPAPTAPVAPEKPKADQKEVDNKKPEEAKVADTQPEDKKDDKNAEDKPADKAATAEAKKPDPQAEYEAALKEYELQKEVYELQKKEYAEKIKAGEKRVAELNSRFADWYYVISEDVFDKLKLKREALVEPVTPEKTEAGDAAKAPAGSQPDAKMEDKAAGMPAATSVEKKAEAPEMKQDAPGESADAGKPEANPPKAEEKPAAPAADKKEEKPTDEKPADPKPAAPATEKPEPAAETPK